MGRPIVDRKRVHTLNRVRTTMEPSICAEQCATAGLQDRPPGYYKQLNAAVLRELWYAFAYTHAPDGPWELCADVDALLAGLHDHNTTWSQFWAMFPYHMREQCHSLDDASIEALAALLHTPANKLHFQHHFDPSEEMDRLSAPEASPGAAAPAADVPAVAAARAGSRSRNRVAVRHNAAQTGAQLIARAAAGSRWAAAALGVAALPPPPPPPPAQLQHWMPQTRVRGWVRPGVYSAIAAGGAPGHPTDMPPGEWVPTPVGGDRGFRRLAAPAGEADQEGGDRQALWELLRADAEEQAEGHVRQLRDAAGTDEAGAPDAAAAADGSHGQRLQTRREMVSLLLPTSWNVRPPGGRGGGSREQQQQQPPESPTYRSSPPPLEGSDTSDDDDDLSILHLMGAAAAPAPAAEEPLWGGRAEAEQEARRSAPAGALHVQERHRAVVRSAMAAVVAARRSGLWNGLVPIVPRTRRPQQQQQQQQPPQQQQQGADEQEQQQPQSPGQQQLTGRRRRYGAMLQGATSPGAAAGSGWARATLQAPQRHVRPRIADITPHAGNSSSVAVLQQLQQAPAGTLVAAGASEAVVEKAEPWRALYDRLTSEDEDLVTIVMDLVPYDLTLVPQAAAQQQLRGLANSCSVSSSVVTDVAALVNGSANTLSLLAAGAGQARSAVAAAVALAASQSQRVLYVNLHGLFHAGDVDSAIMQALFTCEEVACREDQLVGHLKLLGLSTRQPLLLVLDQANLLLRHEGGRHATELIAHVLHLLPNARLLVTAASEDAGGCLEDLQVVLTERGRWELGEQLGQLCVQCYSQYNW